MQTHNWKKFLFTTPAVFDKPLFTFFYISTWKRKRQSQNYSETVAGLFQKIAAPAQAALIARWRVV